MTHKEFSEFVASQVSHEKEQKIDWDKKRDEWLSYLSELYSMIERFLGDYIEKNQISLCHGKKNIFEEYIGEYEADTLEIKLGRNKARLEPIGTNLIAAKGRVDMIGPNGTVKFVLVDKKASAPMIRATISGEDDTVQAEKERAKKIEWSWKIGTPPPNIKYIELNQESFFDSLMAVVNG